MKKKWLRCSREFLSLLVGITKEVTLNMHVFDKRGISKRQGSPHPKARIVTFKLPADAPTDRWTQVNVGREK